MTFNETVQTTIIPIIERMIRNEKEHLDFLIKNSNIADPSWIEQSKHVLIHLGIRLSEYKKFCDDSTIL